jgi:alpha-D-xyloside xylohydrolase
MKHIKFILSVYCFLAFAANSISAQNAGIEMSVQKMDIKVKFYTPDIVRVYKTPQGSDYRKKSESVVLQPATVTTEIATDDNGQSIILKSSVLTVSVDTKTGQISYFTLKGERLFTEKPYGAQFSKFNDAGNMTYAVRQAFLLDEDEAIYGLGQQQVTELNQRNQQHFMRQRALYTSIPIIQSTKGYGLFWDNYSPTTYNDNPQELSFDSQVGECIDYYFMYGKSGDGTVAKIRELTGQSPMFPLWTYGFWQSRERYKSQQEIIEVVDKYRELQVPLDGIIQDWQYWGPNSNWNSMNFDNPEFPEPQKMIDHIHSKNAHIMISIWASFGPDTKQYEELKKMNALLNFKTWPVETGKPEQVKPYDAYNPAARDLYWNYLQKGLFDKNIDAWWTDSTEPDHLDVKESDFDVPTAMGTYRSVVNAFPLMTNRGIYEHQRAVSSEKRVYLLTRCAFAGQQRYGANTWSGDVTSEWATLKKQIPTGLNFSLSGIPYWNTDIGGFFTRDYEGSVSNPAYHELYLRWFQYATFTPMLRSHGSGVKKEIYNLGKKGDWVYDAEEKFIRLRYRLIPYLYSTAWNVSREAGSFLRALFMDFPNDKKTHDLSDEYMFGKSFLVAPVTDPMYVSGEGKKWKNPKQDFSRTGKRDVYLPEAIWYDFWTGKTIQGGQTVSREVPIDIMPVYVRSGSIIPWGPNVQYAAEKKWDNLEIRIYAGADGFFTLYEDENDNYNYEKGAYSTIDFLWNDKDKTLTIDNRKGSFKDMLKSRKFRIVLVGENKGIGVDEASKADKIIQYKGEKIQVKI